MFPYFRCFQTLFAVIGISHVFSYKARLVSTSLHEERNAGLVEILYQGQWNAICKSSTFDWLEASLICADVGLGVNKDYGSLIQPAVNKTAANLVCTDWDNLTLSSCTISTTTADCADNEYRRAHVVCGDNLSEDDTPQYWGTIAAVILVVTPLASIFLIICCFYMEAYDSKFQTQQSVDRVEEMTGNLDFKPAHDVDVESIAGKSVLMRENNT